MNKKIFKKILLLAIIIFIAGIVYFLTQWYKPARDVNNEKGVIVIADTIVNEFANNEKAANAKYLDKPLQVKGEVSEVKKNQDGKPVVMLKTNDPMSGIMCTLKKDENIQLGSQITIKGICTGYLTDVVLIECIIVP